jgi:hypothetical protein
MEYISGVRDSKLCVEYLQRQSSTAPVPFNFTVTNEALRVVFTNAEIDGLVVFSAEGYVNGSKGQPHHDNPDNRRVFRNTLFILAMILAMLIIGIFIGIILGRYSSFKKKTPSVDSDQTQFLHQSQQSYHTTPQQY